jgi:hypothetical protein
MQWHILFWETENIKISSLSALDSVLILRNFTSESKKGVTNETKTAIATGVLAQALSNQINNSPTTTKPCQAHRMKAFSGLDRCAALSKGATSMGLPS